MAVYSEMLEDTHTHSEVCFVKLGKSTNGSCLKL
jgi:hypothetical protein